MEGLWKKAKDVGGENRSSTYQIVEAYDSAIKMKNRLTSAIGVETDFIVTAQGSLRF